MRRGFLVATAVAFAVVPAYAELGDKLSPSLDHPAIEYYNYLKHPPGDMVSELKRRVEEGNIQLKFDGEKGYLPAVLQALHVPVESQVVVFSKTSLQSARIEPRNPRTIFFNDSVAVGWVNGGFIELAALDPKQGVIFYSLEQQNVPQPRFTRRDDCLMCHRSDATLGVPGMLLRSLYTLPDGRPELILGGFLTDHRSPLEERWGGWYVTGSMHHGRHMGNAMLADPDHPEAMITDRTLHLKSLQGEFDTNVYLSSHSDIVALLVLDHQTYLTNLITRVGWEVRCAEYDKVTGPAFAKLLRESANELVDYLLFVDEASLPGPIRGTSGFAEKFEAEGPWDGHRRSLRQFDLRSRTFRYPCSYMIYSRAFDSLPDEARNAVYRRMWQILSGKEVSERYARLSLADRRAIVEILRETKPGLPSYFGEVSR